MEHPPLPVVWVAPRAELFNRHVGRAMEPHGVQVVEAALGASPSAEGAVRVLQTASFPDPLDLRTEYGLDDRPTLVIATTERDELRALEWTRGADEVLRTPTTPAVVAARLQRLLRRAQEMRPQDIDGLTGLQNRRAFDAALREALADPIPQDQRALVLIDLDHFKRLNDAAGHAVGDQVLATVAAALRRAVAPGDVVSRFGGEEFMLLISRYDKATLVKDARALITRIDEALAPFAREHGVALGASAGLTLARPECQAPALLAEVSHALREAKANGRHQLSTHETFVDAGGPPDPEAELERFRNVTRHYADRLTDMVTDMGRRLVEGARRQALEDPLTGVHNRRYFDERIAREVDRARKHERALAVALIDLDHFHAVNATYGWPTGDEVLKRIAGTATGCVRLVDWVARYGGEAFVVVMPETSLDEAAAVAERIRAQVRALVPKSIDGRTLEVSVSSGVAALDPAAMDGPVALLERASSALRRAKDEGRDRVVRAG